MNPTKLLLIQSAYPLNAVKMLGGILKTYDYVYASNGYDFQFPRPVSISLRETVKVEMVKSWFGRKEYEYKTPMYQYYLAFDRELTEIELNAWRMFRIGYIAGITRRQ